MLVSDQWEYPSQILHPPHRTQEHWGNCLPRQSVPFFDSKSVEPERNLTPWLLFLSFFFFKFPVRWNNQPFFWHAGEIFAKSIDWLAVTLMSCEARDIFYVAICSFSLIFTSESLLLRDEMMPSVFASLVRCSTFSSSSFMCRVFICSWTWNGYCFKAWQSNHRQALTLSCTIKFFRFKSSSAAFFSAISCSRLITSYRNELK